MYSALVAALLVLFALNLVFAVALWWAHVATDACLTPRGFRYVESMFSLAFVGLFIGFLSIAGWIETIGS